MAEPWDDSALINAFNSAIAKYKTMHGVAVKDKALSQVVSENFGNIESDSHEIANSNQHAVEQSELSQREENGEVPLLQADKPNSHEDGQPKNNNVEEVPAGYHGYADPQYYAQHHGHSATAENCYLCQWNAYYCQAGAWNSPAASASNGLQCQYCGHVNQYSDATKFHHHQTAHTSQTQPGASAFPDIIKAAVAEALKTVDGQKSAGVLTESSQTNSSFSDVAVAWFLAGFHTSRYLSQKP